ncbi:MAG: ATP-dependent Clp protease ATP-binding subunit, partial [Patescibacteria group bacterium]
RCIGATTPAEYKKFIETDGALERRFQQITIDEPDLERTREILEGIKKYYEKHHGVSYTKKAIETALELSQKYLSGMQYPDKAIDLLDEAGAAVSIKRKSGSLQKDTQRLKQELADIQLDKQNAVTEERFTDAVKLKQQEIETTDKLDQLSKNPDRRRKITIDDIDIMRVIAEMTGIPLKTLTVKEHGYLHSLDSLLKKHIFGQDEVTDRIVTAIRRAKLGLARPDRPLASFLFTGPSGVGKTEMAKIIASTVFQKKSAFLRLDMSEYSAPFTVSKLIGAPAGYVGYREKNKLTDHVVQFPHSVILFDEIEKAHADIHNLLLQIFDDGFLTDSTGKQTNFRHSIIILTSNIGGERFEKSKLGFAKSLQDQQSATSTEIADDLKEHFSREFLNRIDHVCIFNPLSANSLEQIAKRELADLRARIQKRESDFSYSPKVLKFIVQNVSEKLGARDIQRIIQQKIEQPIIQELLSRNSRKNFKISVKKDGNIFLTGTQK